MSALCECGCGLPAPIAKKTCRASGWLKGRPKKFVNGHNRRGNFTDLTRQRFGRLVAIWPVGYNGRAVCWACVCDCGNITYVIANNLRGLDRNTSSCGCRNLEVTVLRSTKHGHSPRTGYSKEYTTWQSMIARCTMPSQVAYPRYGGRGIKVCPEWRVFEKFLAYLKSTIGMKPEGMTFGRINGNKNYEPGNVEWQTPSEQAHEREERAALAA
jgi:hypothetical protein